MGKTIRSRDSIASITMSTEMTSKDTTMEQTSFRVQKTVQQISNPLLKNIVYLKFNRTQTLVAAVVQGGKNIYVIDVRT
jgi:hypothetical protein